MVTRQKLDRRRTHMRQSMCKTCVSFLLALAIVLGPGVWGQITSIASNIQKIFVSTPGLKPEMHGD